MAKGDAKAEGEAPAATEKDPSAEDRSGGHQGQRVLHPRGLQRTTVRLTFLAPRPT